MTNKRTIEDKILLKKTKQNKFGGNYLLLELENGESIFVFSGKVKPNRWAELTETAKYEFTVEEGNNSTNLLIDFTKLEEDNIFV